MGPYDNNYYSDRRSLDETIENASSSSSSYFLVLLLFFSFCFCFRFFFFPVGKCARRVVRETGHERAISVRAPNDLIRLRFDRRKRMNEKMKKTNPSVKIDSNNVKWCASLSIYCRVPIACTLRWTTCTVTRCSRFAQNLYFRLKNEPGGIYGANNRLVALVTVWRVFERFSGVFHNDFGQYSRVEVL